MITVENKDLEILIEAAHAGGEVLKKYFGQVLNMTQKSTASDFQTEADLESEKVILKILKAKFPTYNISSEEEGKTSKNSDYTLVIDPMDGTNNFVIGIPNFSISIALLYKDQPIAGVIYQPILGQTYSALKGKGAYLNRSMIKVNNIVDSKKITIAYTNTYLAKGNYLGGVMNALLSSAPKRVVYNWSAANDYCLLASGKIESMVTDGIEFHDYAAGKLIAIEAGAKIVDFEGKKEKDYKNNHFIVSNSDETNKLVFDLIKPLQKGE